MQQTRISYNNKVLPYLLILPQLVITLVFFLWPAAVAVKGSFFRQDAFGLTSHFVGIKNFIELFTDPNYLNSIWVSVIFAIAVSLLALSSALLLALLVTQVIRNSQYKTLLIWPYAVAPAVAGLLWRFLFDPTIGIISFVLDKLGYHWNYLLNGHQALFLVTIAASWQQFSYNFIFFLAGILAIPKSYLEAAAIDGANSWQRFWSIIFPLLSPTLFFLLTMNLIYAFFQTFGVIQTVTRGGPANATNILVYKVYFDGFYNLNIGSSNAQSVVLMLIVITLTVLQFKYMDKKVHYS